MNTEKPIWIAVILKSSQVWNIAVRPLQHLTDDGQTLNTVDRHDIC